ncbi:MAG: butyrate kinase [Acidobacteriota bacterium]
MGETVRRVLVINPGSTSTKVGVFRREGSEWATTIHHSDDELRCFQGKPILAQADFRARQITDAVTDAGYAPKTFAAVAGRGGLLPPLQCGTYLVNDAMLAELRAAPRGEHASNLGALLARRFADAAAVPAFIVDPVTADEWQGCARLSGLPLIERSAIGHVLNIKAVARRFAREHERRYEGLNLIIVHLGSGITVSAHRGGRMIDQNTPEEGPFGPDRTGWLPVRQLIKLCFSGAYNEKQLDRMVFGDGGLFAYLGTRDLKEIESRIDASDEQARSIYDAMIYQIAKETGAMAAVLQGKVDALLLTGGMAYSERFIRGLRVYIEWIAPITVYPGEDELLALAEGAFRVLDGEEDARVFHSPSEKQAHREALVIHGLE